MKFTKKPITIEAVRFAGINSDGDATFEGTLIPGWIGEAMACAPGSDGAAWVDHERQASPVFMLGTLEGNHHAATGDWIIRGIKGEIYPCKPDIFEATYDHADQQIVAPENMVMANACIASMNKFREYARHHLAKGTQESADKAEVNKQMARMNSTALINWMDANGIVEFGGITLEGGRAVFNISDQDDDDQNEAIASDPVEFSGFNEDVSDLLPVPPEVAALLGALMVAKQEFEDRMKDASLEGDEAAANKDQVLMTMMETAVDNWMESNGEMVDAFKQFAGDLVGKSTSSDQVFVIGQGFVPSDEAE